MNKTRNKIVVNERGKLMRRCLEIKLNVMSYLTFYKLGNIFNIFWVKIDVGPLKKVV